MFIIALSIMYECNTYSFKNCIHFKTFVSVAIKINCKFKLFFQPFYFCSRDRFIISDVVIASIDRVFLGYRIFIVFNVGEVSDSAYMDVGRINQNLSFGSHR